MKLLLLVLGLAGAFPLEDNKVCQPHSRPWQVYGGGWNFLPVCTQVDPTARLHRLGNMTTVWRRSTEQHIHIADLSQPLPVTSPQPHPVDQPTPLPRRCPQPEETCYVSGWGATIPNQCKLVCYRTCMNTFPEFWRPGMNCSGQADTDDCTNDSGSVMKCDGHPADPIVDTKLCKYNDWISSEMDRYSAALEIHLSTDKMETLL
uniref:Uncharacterized protein n=1 Tax=Stegastes partitus TaxID=144197 RepID=A0A3B5AAK5_9TELE